MTQHDASLAAFDKSAQKPFSYRAARFSLWAPGVAFIIGFGANLALKDSSSGSNTDMYRLSWIIIGGLNILLIAAGFIMGFVALIAMARSKIYLGLARAVAGIAIGGLLLAGSAYLVFFMQNLPARTAARLVGQWHATLHAPGSPAMESTLTLSADKRAIFHLVTAGNSVDFKGTWSIRIGSLGDKDKPQLLVRWDPGYGEAAKQGVRWYVDRIEDHQLTLLGQNPDGTPSPEIYQRLKP